MRNIIDEVWERMKEKAVEGKGLVIEVGERGFIVERDGKGFWVKQKAGDLR